MQLRGPAKALTITFPIHEEYLFLQYPTHSPEGEWKKLLIQEIPRVWAEDNPPGLAKHVPSSIVQQISGDMPISVKQYSISSEAMKDTKVLAGASLKEVYLILACQSEISLVAHPKGWNSKL